jgi:hypothetical protein
MIKCVERSSADAMNGCPMSVNSTTFHRTSQTALDCTRLARYWLILPNLVFSTHKAHSD